MSGGSGLRRFVGRAPQPPPAPAPDALAAEAAVELCEMCGTPAGPRHGHVVDTEHRSLMCACRACFLLFTRPDAGGGRFRAVPERCLHDPDRPLTTPEWESLGIPVGAVFFLRGADGLAAFYPSPAGATECLLDLDAWDRLGADHPLLAAAAPDVEAILIHSTAGSVACFLVPIDLCYQLVGLVRLHWKGFDGGQEAHERIDEFFADIRARATTYEPEE
ncbi:MAG TPA: DUF5947 family protein [Actinophytocola sp.]|nr:DUF5947 family protein [Actinophytocola sp.]